MNRENALFSRISSGLWKNLFCPETNLFYDRIREGDEPFGDLPHLSEIARQFPNPGGWGTGMEDCSINSGHMMASLALHHTLHNASVENETEKLLQGVRLCESVHGKKGFLVRAVSHRDTRSCYFNSSRDQLTMSTAGMFDLFQLPGLPPRQKELIKLILSEIACYCRATVTEENHYSYLRLDGGPALVSDLWACDVHEMLRLPMIYGAAFETAKEDTFRKAALEYTAPGLEASEKFDQNRYYWDFPLIQMQLSLELLWRLPFLEEYHLRLEALMKKVSIPAHRAFLDTLEQCENYTEEWFIYNTDWRQLPMKIMRNSLQDPSGSAVLGGYTFMNPVYPEEFFRVVELLRSLGNYLAAALLVPDSPVQKEEIQRFCRFAGSLHYERLTHAGPFSILHALLLAEKRFPELFS